MRVWAMAYGREVRTAKLRAKPSLVALTVLLLWGCGGQEASSGSAVGDDSPGQTSSEQPYAGLEERSIRALSEEKVDDLLAGRGTGYALAAELNHYPGPVHVLELADELDLTPEQERITRDIQTEMQYRAKPLGRELVGLEEQLDRFFRDEGIDDEELARLVNQVADVEGRLRAAHLDAHLKLKEVLSPDQVAAYDHLRGYVGADEAGAGKTKPHRVEEGHYGIER